MTPVGEAAGVRNRPMKAIPVPPCRSPLRDAERRNGPQSKRSAFQPGVFSQAGDGLQGDFVSGVSDCFQGSAGGCGLGDPCHRFVPETGRKPDLMIN